MIVVFSFSMRTRLARPEHVERDVLELDAKILRDRLTCREGGDVLEHGLAAIAEARSLHGGTFRPPRSLLTTRVASASPSMSSAMMRRAYPSAPRPRGSEHGWSEESFFSWMRM
jgi:hypothetical protein